MNSQKSRTFAHCNIPGRRYFAENILNAHCKPLTAFSNTLLPTDFLNCVEKPYWWLLLQVELLKRQYAHCQLYVSTASPLYMTDAADILLPGLFRRYQADID
jgi:hypothetical protein